MPPEIIRSSESGIESELESYSEVEVKVQMSENVPNSGYVLIGFWPLNINIQYFIYIYIFHVESLNIYSTLNSLESNSPTNLSGCVNSPGLQYISQNSTQPKPVHQPKPLLSISKQGLCWVNTTFLSQCACTCVRARREPARLMNLESSIILDSPHAPTSITSLAQ